MAASAGLSRCDRPGFSGGGLSCAARSIGVGFGLRRGGGQLLSWGKGGGVATQVQLTVVARQFPWRDHGNFGLCQLPRETVLLENLLLTPAAGTIELGHRDAAIFQMQLQHDYCS